MEEGKASPAAGSLSSQRCLVDLLDDDDAAIKEEEVDDNDDGDDGDDDDGAGDKDGDKDGSLSSQRCSLYLDYDAVQCSCG